MSDAREDRNHRIEGYVRGQTDEDTLRQLEIEMLEDDVLFERVQTEDLLKRGLEETERVASPQESNQKKVAAPLPRLGWALAASFAAVAIALAFYTIQLSNQIDRLQSPSVGLPVVTLFEQRSLLPEPGDPTSNLAGHTGPVLFEIDVSGYTHSSFQLELVRHDGSLIWEQQVPDERGYLTVMVHQANTLKAVKIHSPTGKALKSYTLSKE